ncbi:far upstream element-binding protein isoform X4 [Ciona intestinalis]
MAAVTANASGDAQIDNISAGVDTTNAQLTEAKDNHSTNSPGPMGDAPNKRPLEDGEEPGPKKLATPQTSAANSEQIEFDNLGMQENPDIMSDTIRLPDDLVGLIIGRGGENIMRMQRETGCRIQITQSIPGTKERPCTLSGTQEQIEVCRNMLNEIISRSQAGTLGSNFSLSQGGLGGMGDGGMEKSIEIAVPPDKCGLIIGKGGETIKMLQQSLGVKMLLIQDSTDNIGQSKPLRITGPQLNVDNAVSAVHQMMANRDQQIAQQKMERDGGGGNGGGGQGGMDPNMFGDDVNKTIIPVPKAAVGVVIGKGGDMINQIQNVTGTRVQFKPEDPTLPERMCSVMGPKEGVDAAIRRIHEIIQNVQERDGGGGGGSGGGGGGHPGGMGGFGQWEGPNMGRGGRGMGMASEEHLVPANKTGLVIGKGGDTIKQINMQSGAHAEIQRNPPPGSDLNYKTFIIKGTPEQIKMARQLIQEKVDAGPGGSSNGQMHGGHMGGQPPMGNFGPPPHQQGGYGGLPPAAGYGHPSHNPLQGPPQAPQAPQSYQQPWGNQFQQWNSPTVSAPQQNGADPTKPVADSSNAAAWQTYLQMYGAQAQAYQQPAAAAAVSAAPASQPDYSKQWDEYLKQNAAAVAEQRQQLTLATPAAAAAIQQQQVAAPAAAAPAASAAVQPATTQAADYSAAWAEYYRQYYAMHGQAGYAAAAAAAGQAPAPT